MSVGSVSRKLMIQEVLKTFYDIQKERVSQGNRIAVTEFSLCPNRHLVPLPKRKKFDGTCPICGAPAEIVIKEPNPVLVEVHRRFVEIEKMLYRELERLIRGEPLYEVYLKHVKGVGPAIAAYIIAVLEPTRFATVSKLYKYCGLHVVFECERCGRRYERKEAEKLGWVCPRCGGRIVGRAPRRRRGEKAEWNPKARTMMWKLGTAFIKVGGVYRGALVEFLEKSIREHGSKWTSAHHLAHACRVTVKLFISHVWEVSRLMAKLPAPEPYPTTVEPHRYVPPLIDLNPKRLERYVDFFSLIQPCLKRAGLTLEQYVNLVEEYKARSQVKIANLLRKVGATAK